MDLHESLILAAETGRLPDVVFAPSDLAGFAATLKLSEIPASVASKLGVPEPAWETVTYHDRRLGIPVLDGNHLLLFYNRKLVARPAATWAEVEADKQALGTRVASPMAVDYQNAYVFLTMLASHGGWPFKGGKVDLDTPVMAEALAFYKSLGDKGLVLKDCGFECVTKRFYSGSFAYALNGDWAIGDARTALGKDLGLATLMTGQSVQERWYREAGRIPVRAVAVELLGAGSDDERAMVAELRATRPLPTDPELQTVWVALQKGLSFALDGGQMPAQAAKAMQNLARSTRGKPP